jgi:hypothetical protein
MSQGLTGGAQGAPIRLVPRQWGRVETPKGKVPERRGRVEVAGITYAEGIVRGPTGKERRQGTGKGARLASGAGLITACIRAGHAEEDVTLCGGAPGEDRRTISGATRLVREAGGWADEPLAAVQEA